MLKIKPTLIFILFNFNFCIYISNAQDIRDNIIKDINTNYQDAIINDILDFNGKTYFLLSDYKSLDIKYSNRFKLVMYDNTTNDLVTIKEDSLYYFNYSTGLKFHKTNSNHFYFTISNIVNYFSSNEEIWYSDGSSIGTKKINSLPYIVIGSINNCLYLYTKLDNNELFGIYKLVGDNGTPILVTSVSFLQTNDIKIGAGKIFFATYNTNTSKFNLNSLDSNDNIQTFFSNTSEFLFLGNVKSKQIFYANNTTLGSGTYSTDGSVGSVTKILPVGYQFMVGVNVKDLLYFRLDRDLYSTDGTHQNTKSIQKDIFPNFNYSNLSLKDELLYNKSETNELWKTNGITTVKLSDSSKFLSYPILNNKFLVAIPPDSSFMYFVNSNESNHANKLAKYYYNSTNISTLDLGFKYIYRIKFFGTDLLIEGELKNTTIGSQLYIYRNNILSLFRIINTNTKGINPDNIQISDGYLFYTGYHQNINGNYGYNLIFSKGLSENTFQIPYNIQDNFYLFFGSTFFKKNTNAFYIFNSGGVGELNLQTKSLKTLTTYNLNVSRFAKINQSIIFFDTYNLYKYDTTNNTYSVLKNFGTDSYYLYAIDGAYLETKFNNFYYFFTYGQNKYNLWKTDGTTEGTQFVKTWSNVDVKFGDILRFYLVNNYVILKSYNFSNNTNHLWKSDGTMEGTTYIAQIPNDNGGYDTMYDNGFSDNIFSDGQNLYISVKDDSFNINIYKTNSTLTNLDFIQTLQSLPNSGYLTGKGQAFCKCQNNIYFFNYNNYSSNLWKIDPNTLNITKITTFVNELYLGNPICTGKVIWIPTLSIYNIYGIGYKLLGFNTLSNETSISKNIFTRTSLGYFAKIIIPFNNSIIYQKNDEKYGLEMFMAGECESNNLRNGTSVTGDYYYTDAVQTQEIVQFPNAVSIFSEKNLLLLPGFEAKNGSVFYSTIKTCK